jgi:pyruvate dehydrogenase complex dehydrogenase (E1) component
LELKVAERVNRPSDQCSTRRGRRDDEHAAHPSAASELTLVSIASTEFAMRTVDQVRSLVPEYDGTVYLVLDHFGRLGSAYRETDEEHADL